MIGIFDSGIGGLTVAREFKRLMPSLPVVYVGDTARVPWGNKSPKVIREYSCQICDFLISQKISTIVIACNTASAVAGEHLRKKYPDVEFVDVVEPVVERVVRDGFRKVSVIGTRATIASGTYRKKILAKNPRAKVYSQACPLFVPLAEESWTTGDVPQMVAKKYFQIFSRKDIDAIILGCTHYSLLKTTIRKALGKKVKIVSCASETAKIFKQKYFQTGGDLESANQPDRYYFTDINEHNRSLIGKIMNRDIKVKKIFFETRK